MTSSADASSPARGVLVRCAMTKWGERPHYQFVGWSLGTDVHGAWLGFPAGTTFRRPGAEFIAPVDQVTCVPRIDDRRRRVGHLATFHAAGGPVQVYVDITGVPEWMPPGAARGGAGSEWRLHAVDLDLDVIASLAGEVVIDDVDEFDRHREEFGYPDSVVAGCRAEAQAVQSALRSRVAPYDGTARSWFAVLSGLSVRSGEPGDERHRPPHPGSERR